MNEKLKKGFDSLLNSVGSSYNANDIIEISFYNNNYYISFSDTTEMYKIDKNLKTITFIDFLIYEFKVENDGKTLSEKADILYTKRV